MVERCGVVAPDAEDAGGFVLKVERLVAEADRHVAATRIPFICLDVEIIDKAVRLACMPGSPPEDNRSQQADSAHDYLSRHPGRS